MIRVCLKNNPDITGTVVGEKSHGAMIVRWDGGDPETNIWIIGRDRLVVIEDDGEKE